MLAILRNFILEQQHEEATSHIRQQVPAAVAIHLTEAVYCALLDITITKAQQNNKKHISRQFKTGQRAKKN